MTRRRRGTDGPRPVTGRGWPVGRIVGVRILITPSWIASVAAIAALGVPVVVRVVPGTGTPVAVLVATGLGVLLGLSVLAHELGHCVVARLVGIEVIAIRLYLLGGASELAAGPRRPRDEALVAAAGPAVSGLLAGAFWLLLQPFTPGTIGALVLLLLALSNLIIGVFNLLPALPLDGGRVIRAGIWGLSGSRRAGTVAAAIGGGLLVAALLGWAVLLLVDQGTAGLLPAGIAMAMALFVLVGVITEGGDDRPGTRSPGFGAAAAEAGIGSLRSAARPVQVVPDGVTVTGALTASDRGPVILAGADGVTRGVLDVAAARDLAVRDPDAPATLVARPVPAEAIVFDGDDPDEVLDRARNVLVDPFVLVDEAGLPVALLPAADILSMSRRSANRSGHRTNGKDDG